MYKEKTESCGKRIEKALIIRKMNQAELCKLADIPKSSLSLYLKGTYEPKQDKIYKMASVLNVSEIWLMGYDVPMERNEITSSNPMGLTDSERIMLDSSSTAIYIIKKLKEKKGLTVITNSVVILLELADKSDWKVLSTGGNLKEGALSLTGSSAEKMIRSYHVDTAICSCKGVDMSIGVTDSNEKDSLIKQAMFASAERRILAADTLKFDKKSFVRVCEFSDIDVLVTDSEPSAQWQGFCKDNKVEIVY